MLIGKTSEYLLKKTRAKSKMYEYGVPLEDHIEVEKNVKDLFLIAIGAIGDISNRIWYLNGSMDIIEIENSELKFASSFFDSFMQSKINELMNNDSYYALLGSIAYYFSDLIGSSKVMLKRIDSNLDVGCGGIEKVIVAILNDDLEDFDLNTIGGRHRNYLSKVIKSYISYFSKNIPVRFEDFDIYKRDIYNSGTPRELLLSDALLAIFVKKVNNSALNMLPKFSNISDDLWEEFLLEKNSIKELWPSQVKLGKSGIFSGKSGVIQMPTSSGKTTSIALVVRSAFLAERTNLSIIVAPFRALCKEISIDLYSYFESDLNVMINEFSDIPDIKDLSIFQEIEDNKKHIMVLTPEKLINLLRSDMTILESIGLIVFDEAHMFDDGSRGIGYELLISTIKHCIPREAQKILISAIIPNASIINDWINGEEGISVSDNLIRSATKTIAIGDWKGDSGQLYFINPENPDEQEFFVPRVVEINQIRKIGQERNDRFFPDVDFSRSKVNTNDMSIYYALKLIVNGGIAIFCGKKDSADKILTRILDLENRGVDIYPFEEKVKNSENEKIAYLVAVNLGEENNYYKTALKGILIHHAGIPNGIRMSAEYAMSKDLIGCIVCTSTLAQGVNLPIKYLIISSIYQAGEKIKVRDFHNLIGRTGRAGKHTEGTVILSEPFVYSRKSERDNQWRWRNYKDILNPENSESCKSNLLKLVQTVTINLPAGRGSLNIPFEHLIELRYEDYEGYKETIRNWRQQFEEGSYPEDIRNFFERELSIFENSMSAVESYILSFMIDGQYSLEYDIRIMAQNTLGYHLANIDEKKL
ncbi:DEAD/DEAH box helicase [Enterococcus mundtii]|uniref:DEAD/DEAH box helicase n=1 Tax=Enterococcus mundtii TaxID=53346 RepID=UPI0011576EA3|nr:DEAD/DEAH box helicase [Enterococcus mundtii]